MAKQSLFTRVVNRFFGAEIDRRVQLMLTGIDGFYDRGGGLEMRDRFDYDREEILRQALEAWRVNPLARRIIELTSQYVVGGGVSIESKHPGTDKFIKEWWNHPLNQMPMRVFELCDELTRAGELFIVLSTDAAGMSYIRALPAGEIAEIRTAQNDLEQEISYTQKANQGDPVRDIPPTDVRTWPAYDALQDGPNDHGDYPSVILHFAINRPAGAVHGESDLAPLLRWLVRYAGWLEDRARLNRFRQTFLFVVKSRFASEAERLARQTALNTTPPSPGSILVTDEGEEWEVINPELDSSDAEKDGLALKKMIAAGSGIPLHFLAEPESATRTTAESAGGPTFRHFEQRQVYFVWMIKDIIRVVIRRRALATRSVIASANVDVRGADIASRDNTALSIAATTIVNAFKVLRDRGLIDDNELMRMVYKFAGEVVDVEDLMREGKAAPDVVSKNPLDKARMQPVEPGNNKPANADPGAKTPAGVKVDPITGDVRGAE